MTPQQASDAYVADLKRREAAWLDSSLALAARALRVAAPKSQDWADRAAAIEDWAAELRHAAKGDA